jgi:FixJ family two-component response regulator
MPGMSGVELAAVARRTRPQMPVIFISGYSDETEALAAVMQSGGILLGKPFSRSQLAQVIQSAMSSRPSAGA